MAAYATLAQAEELYGVAYIAVACDRDNSGAVDLASFTKHLNTATSEMNMRLLGRYPLPLATPPEHFQKLCVDIAVYNGCPTADVCTQLIKDRYAAAIATMDMIATGKLKLEIAPDTTTNNVAQTAQVNTARTLELMPGSRTMTRDSLRKLL